jgi:hypothetical protein
LRAGLSLFFLLIFAHSRRAASGTDRDSLVNGKRTLLPPPSSLLVLLLSPSVQAAIPYYVVEGLLVVTYLGAPLWTALEGLLGKVARADRGVGGRDGGGWGDGGDGGDRTVGIWGIGETERVL